MIFAIATAVLAIFVGVILAALDQPPIQADVKIERLSGLVLIAGSVTAAAGTIYGIGGWLLT
jgi:hypothetical protein